MTNLGSILKSRDITLPTKVHLVKAMVFQIWKTQQWPQDWKRSVFIPIPKKGNAKECSNYCTIALISHVAIHSCSCLESSRVGGAWWAAVSGVAQSRTRLKRLSSCSSSTSYSEKAMAPHSSTRAWKIPWTEKPHRLQSMGSLRFGYDWVTEHTHKAHIVLIEEYGFNHFLTNTLWTP